MSLFVSGVSVFFLCQFVFVEWTVDPIFLCRTFFINSSLLMCVWVRNMHLCARLTVPGGNLTAGIVFCDWWRSERASIVLFQLQVTMCSWRVWSNLCKMLISMYHENDSIDVFYPVHCNGCFAVATFLKTITYRLAGESDEPIGASSVYDEGWWVDCMISTGARCVL